MGVSAAARNRDLLVLLASTAVGLPLAQKFGLASKVLGFLAIGIFIGPSGFAWVSDINFVDTLGEVGIIFFLCEMGLELSFDRLKNMRRDVFGLGLAQFVFTGITISLLACKLLGLSQMQAIILGTALSLSSSAFALQLLDEAKERGTMHGRAAFGILLFQDLVVPLLLVLLPALSASGGAGLGAQVAGMAVNSALALLPVFIIGKSVLGRLFSFVAEAGNPVALRALSFFTVFGICYIFQVFGLSNTLGAFVAGVLLSGTAYREQVMQVISPIREDLLGLFFVTVGFGIDLGLVLTKPLLVLSTVSSLLLVKALVTMIVCRIAGMGFANAQQVGLLLCQAGEFSFVMFGIAAEAGAFTKPQTKLLLTITSVSMACTPFLAKMGRDLAKSLQEQQATPVGTSEDRASEMREKLENARVIICGYGRVGTLITQLMDTKFIPWVAFDVDKQTVAEARAKDLPVFVGDLPEVASRILDEEVQDQIFDSRKIAVVTPADSSIAIEMVQNLRETYPELKIIARAMGKRAAQNMKQYSTMPIVPGLPEDTMLMNLPIGASVLRNLGYSEEDAESVINVIRREYLANEDKISTGKGKAGTLASLIRWYQAEQQRIEEEKEARRLEEERQKVEEERQKAEAELAEAELEEIEGMIKVGAPDSYAPVAAAEEEEIEEMIKENEP